LVSKNAMGTETLMLANWLKSPLKTALPQNKSKFAISLSKKTKIKSKFKTMSEDSGRSSAWYSRNTRTLDTKTTTKTLRLTNCPIRRFICQKFWRCCETTTSYQRWLLCKKQPRLLGWLISTRKIWKVWNLKSSSSCFFRLQCLRFREIRSIFQDSLLLHLLKDSWDFLKNRWRNEERASKCSHTQKRLVLATQSFIES